MEMGYSRYLWGVFLSLNIVDTVMSDAICGSNYCDGYCCSYDLSECCYYYVYHFWWFWFLWVIIFTLIASCSICCYRRRRYNRSQYTIVSDAHCPPAYGTVVSVSSNTPQVATAPPPYQPQQKPPAYMP